jgi:hypothetical protein
MKNVIVIIIATLFFAIPTSAEQFIKFGGYRPAGLVKNTIPACGNGKLSARGISSGDSFEVWDLAASATDLVGGRLIATFDDSYAGERVDYVASNGRIVVNVPTAGRFESNMTLINHDCEFSDIVEEVPVFDVTDYGAVSNDGLNDVAGFQAAADAACAVSGNKTIEIPAGDFNMGDVTETSFYNGSSLVIDSGCDDLTIQGSGRDATRLLASSPNGQVMIAVCPFGTIDCDAADKGVTKNFALKDLMFADLDPPLHGSQNSGYAFADAPTGGSPAYGDPVSWSGGSGLLLEYDGSRNLYVISSPTNTPSGTLSSSAGWSAGTITSGVGTRTEGTHGLVSKFVEGMTIERVSCDNLSDECLDLKESSNRVVIRDFKSTDVGQISEGGAAISIDCSDGVTVDGFYIDGGAASLEPLGTGSGITVSTNCRAVNDDPITQNIRIMNGALLDTSTAPEDQQESGLTVALAGVSPSNPDANAAIIRNVVVQNVTIAGYQKAIIMSGSSGSGQVTFINTVSDGIYQDTISYRNRLVTSRFENNVGNITLQGIEYMSGSYVSSASATDALTVGHPFTMVGSEIEHTAFNNGNGDDCLQLNSGPNMVTGSIFRTCGLGTSAGHRPMDSGTASFGTVVTGNQKIGGHSTSAFGTGAASPGTGCGGGFIVGGGVALCDNNLINP